MGEGTAAGAGAGAGAGTNEVSVRPFTAGLPASHCLTLPHSRFASLSLQVELIMFAQFAVRAWHLPAQHSVPFFCCLPLCYPACLPVYLFMFIIGFLSKLFSVFASDAIL